MRPPSPARLTLALAVGVPTRMPATAEEQRLAGRERHW